MSAMADADAEDVNDFLKRIQELGTRRDQEDEERNRKLEEEILQGRKERQARRAERARSISPTKDSPVGTPTTAERFERSARATLSPAPDLKPSSEYLTRENDIAATMDSLTGGVALVEGSSTPLAGNHSERLQADVLRTAPAKTSPSNSTSRNSPSSSQQRPASQVQDRSRVRPLSMIAAENAARSPRATPEPAETDEQFPISRDQVSQMLGSKDPAWFRQTADRGENSPAYRRNQVEDSNVVEVAASSRRRLPGMAREPTPLIEKINNSEDVDRASPSSRQISSNMSMEKNPLVNAPLGSTGIGSPLPLTNAQRLDPPVKLCPDDEASESSRAPAMSPSQGRISPDRADRPVSPTKGVGGFVQSAMMKRSDSVSKRWSVQSPPGMNRGNSVASNRSSVDPSAYIGVGGGKMNQDPRPSSLSRDNSPIPLSRPTSSHSNVTVTQFSERPGTSSSMRSSVTTSTANDGFVKPLLPVSRVLNNRGGMDCVKDIQDDMTAPSSPSKLTDNRRWSPTKASWLESALNKPDSPKPKAPPPPQQPAWMAEIARAKQRGSTDQVGSPPINKQEVNIGGLLRSPPPGVLTKSGVVGISVGTPPISTKKDGYFNPALEPSSKVETPVSLSDTSDGSKAENMENAKSVSLTKSAMSASNKTAPPTGGKSLPETPPKKDFRSNLKSRQVPSNDDAKEEPEFKNVFGQLRRTKTQNYVAPDELKDNILRGKAGLNVTGGPKKTERKDDFKEAILKKKEDFKKSQLDGTGVIRPPSGSSQHAASVPEALAKKASLGRSSVLTPQKPLPLESTSSSPSPTTSKSSVSAKSGPLKDLSLSSRTQGGEIGGGKLAERFNPALATIIARGPPSTLNTPSRTSSLLAAQRDVSINSKAPDVDTQKAGPQLTHMTKARARGPRRKAPSAVMTSNPVTGLMEMAREEESVFLDAEVIVRQDNTASNPMIKPTITQSLKHEDDIMPLTLPRKLDIKRQSKFLEVANKGEKSSQQKDDTKSVQLLNGGNAVENPIAKRDSGFRSEDQKVPPSAKPKPASLSSPPLLREQPFATRSAPRSAEVERKPQHTTVLNSTKNNSFISLAHSKNAAPIDKIANDTNSVVPVKNSTSTSLFNRRDAEQMTHESSPQANAPVKLPKNKGEMTAIPNADLRLPQSTGIIVSKDFGLGLHGVSISSADDGKATEIATLRLSLKTNGPTTPSTNSSKGLTTPSSTPAEPLPPNAEIKLTSSRKITNQAVPQSSEASKLLVDFFGENQFDQKFDVDTTAALLAVPEDPAKIKTLRSQLYQLSSDGKKQQVPTYQERMLFESDMYICHHTYGTLAGKKIVQVYFWAGDDVAEPSIQDAEIFAHREARSVGAKLIKIRQGQEPPEFVEALGGILITRRGSSIKYDSLTPHILCGRRYAGSVVFDEVDFSPTILCSGFPYLISTKSGKSYLWKGKGSGVDELSCARLIGMDFGVTGDVEEIEDGNEPPSFLNIFGANTKIMKSADHWRLKPSYQKYSARLFCADNEVKAQITEISPFTQSSLSSNKIYVLDAFFEIYIIVGSSSRSQYSSFCTALLFAQEYGILAAGMQDRPFVPVSTVVLQGIPRDLKFVFRKWRDVLGPTVMRSQTISAGTGSGLARGKSLRVVPLSAALDATRF